MYLNHPVQNPGYGPVSNGSYDVGVAYWLMLLSSAAKEPWDNGVSQALKLAITNAEWQYPEEFTLWLPIVDSSLVHLFFFTKLELA